MLLYFFFILWCVLLFLRFFCYSNKDKFGKRKNIYLPIYLHTYVCKYIHTVDSLQKASWLQLKGASNIWPPYTSEYLWT